MSGTNQLLMVGDQQNGIGAGFMSVVGGGRWTGSTEVVQQTNLKVGATLSNLSVVITGGLAAGTLVSRIGGSNGNLTCTGTAVRATDTTHTDSITANSLINYKYTTGFDTAVAISCQMNTTTPYTLQGSGQQSGNADYSLSVTTAWLGSMGASGGGLNNLSTQQLMEVAGTVSQLGVNITTATSGTGTVNFTKNGTAGNNVCTLGSGITGLVLDTTHSDSISAGDLLNHSVVSTNASGAIHTWTFSYAAASTSGMDGTASLEGGTSAGPTFYDNFGGQVGTSATQSSFQSYCSYACTASNLRVTQFQNTSTAAVVVFQNNGSNGNQTITWTSGGGTFIDSTHTDSVSATNLIGNAFTSGTINFTSVGVTLDDGSVAPSTITARHAIRNI